MDKDAWKEFFPYKPRELQISMQKIIYHFLKSRTHMVLEASTGTGKTIVNLSALLPYAKEHNLKIVYTARTHSQIDRVVEELQQISKLTPVSGTALRGRSSFCINSLIKKYTNNNHQVQILCTQLKKTNKCEYFVNMKDEKRLKPVLMDLISMPATAEYVFDVCESASICPAEAVRKILPEVDVIACSYLYIFDPIIRKPFLDSLGCELSDLIIIIDEAHNLPDMVNNISSDSLSSITFSRAMREAKRNHRDDFLDFLEVTRDFLYEQDKKLKVNEEQYIDPALLLEELELKCNIELDREFFEDMQAVGEEIRFKLAKSGKEPRSSLGRIGDFFAMWFESIGLNDFTHSIDRRKFLDGKDTYVLLNLSALDPSKNILSVLSEVHISLSVTGTLGDPEAFTLLTGINKLKHMTNIFPSPYNSRNVKSIVLQEITTTYKHRSPIMYRKMVNAIVALADETPANIGLFAPSYKILQELMANGLERLSPKEIMLAKSGMKSQDNDKLVEEFKRKAKGHGAILCTVLGGRSSEGADFPGDTMNAVIIVGIPYAPPTVKSQQMIKYMESKFPGRGRQLAYEIPAIIRAAQASGRPIRSLNDSAFIMYLDYRYASQRVKARFPEWIRSSMELIPNEPAIIKSKVREFFAKK